MQAGRLRHRVTLQTYTESQDTFGGVTQTWADLATVWAEIRPLAGREYLDAKQLEAEVSTKITIRQRSLVNERTRVLWTDPDAVAHVFEVVSVIADPTAQRQLTLMCMEVE